MENHFLTIKDISIAENKSIKTIRRLIAAKKIRISKNQGKLNLIHKDDYFTWKKSSNKFEIDKEFDIKFEENVSMDKFSLNNIKNEFLKRDGWNSNYRNGYKFIDLFAGAGGLSCGFVMAGFEPVASVEIASAAVETYNYNFNKKFSNELIENRDITDENVKKDVIKKGIDEKVDVIIGGFPCQGFSLSGNRILIDERNFLYTDMLKIVNKIRPKVVIMENVEGLRSMLDGKVELKIISDYQKIGYKISALTLNSADYGVAQKRKRVIFVANKIDKVNIFPKPFLEKKYYKTLGQEIERFMNIEEDHSINHIFTKHTEEMKKNWQN